MAYRQNRSVSRTKNGSTVRAGRPHLQILRAESSSSSRLSGLEAHHVVAAVITAAVGPVPVALCRPAQPIRVTIHGWSLSGMRGMLSVLRVDTTWYSLKCDMSHSEIPWTTTLVSPG